MANHSRKRKSRPFGGDKLVIGLIAVVLVLVIVIITLIATRSEGNTSSVGAVSLNSIGAGSGDSASAGTDGSSGASSSSGAASASSNSSSSASSNKTSSSEGNYTDMSVDFNLVLVNQNNRLPLDFTVDVSKITDEYSSPVGLKFDSRAVDNLNQLFADASESGVNLIAISSYRAMSRQIELYNDEVAKQKRENPDYSDAKAKEEAGKNVAVPGTSEHQLGLAVDFNTDQVSFENTKEFAWLKANAAKYGFVNRYPKDKTSITGINYEPWHWRYVGVEHANKMNELSYCLEEYVEYLKTH